MEFSSFLRCPLCGGALSREGGSLFCDGHTGRRHCYDIATAGYVNLLPPGKGGNARTGDDGAMIAARSAFLSGGYYNCISDSVARLALRHVPARTDSISVCDAGAGEGYHTCRIACRMAEWSGRRVEVCGVEASKKGATCGARSAKTLPGAVNASFVAGNIFSLPVADVSLDVMLSLFAPIPVPEAYRTLRKDGILVVVAAAPRHLWELRCLLYEEPREGNDSVPVPDGFDLEEKYSVRERMHIPSQEHLRALFTMTPFYYRTPESGRARLAAVDSMDIGIAADIYVFRKISSDRERTAE